jgi:putative intracellular protease/amidase
MRIDILLYAGADELDVMAPFEVLKNAAACGADFAVRFVALTGPGEFIGAHGARLWAEASIDATSRPDLLVVPGGGWSNRAPQGVRPELERGDIPRLLARLHEAGTILAAVCTGTLLLSAAGLLHGVPATSHHGALEYLATTDARLVQARVVDAGTLITSGAVTSGLDMALWVVERFAGPSIACAVEVMMEYERRGTVWRGGAASRSAR